MSRLLRIPAVARLAALAGVSIALACSRSGAPATLPSSERACFVDVTAPSRIDFRHRRCGSGEKQLIEMNGGAVAVLDYDRDGKLDLYFPQGEALPGFDAKGVDLRDRMYRGLGGGSFADVTDAVSCSEPGYSFGTAAGDYDGDGDADLFVCNYGCNRLLRNDVATAGRFTDVTEAAGVRDTAWSSCAAFADFDRDGDLDLYVGNYVKYDELHPLWCGDQGKGPQWRSYCHPDQFPGAPDQLLRNNGDGTFTDWTKPAGMSDSAGKCLGLVVLDYDEDGDADLYVSNDSTPNFLWRNEGGLRFTNVADDAGCAVGGTGLSQASMGVDSADVDLDGDFDLVVTNLDNEGIALYRNDSGGFFSYRSFESGLGDPSLPFVGFGARFLDVDHDQDEDLVVVNGHVVDNIGMYREGARFEQPAHLYWNDGHGRFKPAGSEAGEWFERRRVGRALATLDFDDDGDLDLVAVENDGGASLLRNELPSKKSWIGFTLGGRDANVEALGARVTISAGGRVQRREQRGTCSYNAFVDRRVHFGLGDCETIDWVEVRWPRGATTRLERLAARRYHVLDEPAPAR